MLEYIYTIIFAFHKFTLTEFSKTNATQKKISLILDIKEPIKDLLNNLQCKLNIKSPIPDDVKRNESLQDFFKSSFTSAKEIHHSGQCSGETGHNFWTKQAI